MSFLQTELPWDSPTVASIPLPPFRDDAQHRRYVRMLQLHLALLDAGPPTLSTVALSLALDHPQPGGGDSRRWLTPLELSVSLTSWFPAPWTPELLAQTLRRQHRDGPAQINATWRWLGDPDFSAEPDQSGWTILRFERGNTDVGKLPGDRALTVLWMDHFREKFGFPLAHKVDAADVTALAPASLAIITADRTDAKLPYRASWRAQRQAALTDVAADHPSAS